MSPTTVIKNNKRLDILAKKLLTVGDENRLKILCVLFNRKKCCVSEIADELKLHIAVVSHHLQTLSETGLLTSAREGKRICYIIKDEKFLKDLKNLVCKYN
jgi:DNA-binding transcriptional ArsR family regulator